jgi:hypothetical protein
VSVGVDCRCRAPKGKNSVEGRNEGGMQEGGHRHVLELTLGGIPGLLFENV